MSDDSLQIGFLLIGSFDWVQHGTLVMRSLLLVWMTLTGAFVGSFMNVVVYRLPAGLNLSHPGSRCPSCLHSIRAYDNIPVLSWLALRGRCRDCAAPISPRYPSIEALMAVVFAAVAAVAMWNHPVVMQATRAESDLLKLVVAAVSPLICWLLLICTLVCAALIERDRQPVPVRLFWPACVVGVLAAYFVPLVPLGHLGGGLLPGIAGLLIGAGWGGMLLVIEAACVGQRAASEHASERRWSHLGRVMAPRGAALAACGVLLGWQVTGPI